MRIITSEGEYFLSTQNASLIRRNPRSLMNNCRRHCAIDYEVMLLRCFIFDSIRKIKV